MKNNNSLSNIGARIKKLRLLNNMTQSELAGDKMTRNMLSRIENSAALPSLGTLLYLSERLKVPAGCLLEEEAFFDYLRADLVRSVHALMKSREYVKALELIKTSGLNGDEITLLIIECDLEMARESCKNLKYRDAYLYLSDALPRCKDTVYSTAGCGYTANLYYELAKRFLPPFDKKNSDTVCTVPEFDKYIDLYVYLRLTDLFDSSQVVKAVNLASLCEISDKVLSTHIAARLDMANGRYNDASSKLKSIINSQKQSPSAHRSLILFRVYDDLEQCAKGENDYVSAYQYKEEKLKLYEKASGIKL